MNTKSEIEAKIAELKADPNYPYHPMHAKTAELEYLEEDLAEGYYIEDDEN